MKQAHAYAPIVKMDDNGDGTLTVYGKATDDSVDRKSTRLNSSH